jgi:pyruvate dehydrogenase E2 component (dihydrolipoamide acetyltransferase)
MPEVIMPKMGDAMTEGKLLRWMKQQGDAVKKGEPIAEIETDKVNVDIEAEWDGVLSRLVAGAGDVVPVGSPIAVITRPGEQVAAAPAAAKGAQPGAARTGAGTPGGTGVQPGRPATAAAPTAGHVRASPLAKRLAEQHGISLQSITGTGPQGRITEGDVEAAIARAAGPTPAAPAAASAPPAGGRDVALTRMRQTIARRMTESKQTTPHIYLTMSVRMDTALDVRRELNDRLGAERKISVNDLVVKAAAMALVKYPNLNASFTGNAVRHPGEININVAVSLPDGLISPVLHHCDQKPLWQIAQESKALAERARGGRLKPEDLTGGTFTVSNLGMFDLDEFAAIITPPQAAVLAVASAKPQAVVKDGRVEVATIMLLTLSSDHRVTDGAESAQFLGEVRQLLENPAWLIAEGLG